MTQKSKRIDGAAETLTMQVDEAQLIRIAEALELLERMVSAELDPERQCAIWNVLAEAKCS